MKSKTSFFNFHIYRNDIRRHYPLWLLYTIGIGVILMAIPLSRRNTWEVLDWLIPMTAANAAYGSLCAIVLFGDLFDSRRCNALHSLPLTRDCWFVSHLASGLTFGVVPYLVICAVNTMQSPWAAAPLGMFFLGSVCQFVIFFGIALFCVMITGNIVGSVLLTGFLNLLSLQVYCFVALIYVPLLRGVVIDDMPFARFSPLAAPITRSYYDYHVEHFVFTEGWQYLCIYFAVAVVLIAAAWLLYRKRNLECAGDFLAFRGIAPVLTVAVSLFTGSLLYGFFELVGVSTYLNLALGVSIAFFVCQMLIRKSVKVFDGRTLLRFAGLAAALAISLFVTSLDPMGIESYVPDAEDVDCAWVDVNYTYMPQSGGAEMTAAVIDLHKQLLEAEEIPEDTQTWSITLRYVLKNGALVERRYAYASGTKAEQAVNDLSSTRLMVFGGMDVDLLLGDPNYQCYVNETPVSREVAKELFDAIGADCDAKHFSQAHDKWDAAMENLYICFRSTREDMEEVRFDFCVPGIAINSQNVIKTYDLGWK